MKRSVVPGGLLVAWAAKYIIRCLCFLLSYRHSLCVISLRGLKKGEPECAREFGIDLAYILI
jgi:hypothetical protein